MRNFMDRNVIKDILIRLSNLKGNESISIDDLNKEFSNLELEELLKIISVLSSRYYIKIEGKYSSECSILEKYNRITGLEKDGYVALDFIQNDKIWNKVEKYLKENEYDDFSIFMTVSLAKRMVEKEFDKYFNIN